MTAVTLIFPHQLFASHPCIVKGQAIYLIEEFLFFKQYRFHRQKLVLHRASMKKYARLLDQLNVKVNYIDSQNELSDVRQLIPHLAQQNVTGIQLADVADKWLMTRIKSCCNTHNIKITKTVSPNFLNTIDGVKPFFDDRKTYFQTAFYIEQRKQRNILLNPDGQPLGGQWTFDAANRLKYPKNDQPPAVTAAKEDSYLQEAKVYVAKYFPNIYGSAKNFIYPTDHADASIWLDEFLETRFEKFGSYEDAMVVNEHYLHHSVLTPMLNIGLLSPHQIIDRALLVADNKNIPLNSLEGFIRQIMGWREFIRIVYEREGGKQRTKNFWGFERKIPESFWQGTTGIFPVDNVIKKVLQTGYSHHIERLMVIGNFMLLCEFHPDEVYRWFMEMYVDAYDWVMVPNVYGMSQFADGGLMTTKPYISGSHYLLKMSDYQKGAWTEIWDGLFWRFMHVHRDFFLKNPRLGMLVKTFDKMPEEKRKKHIAVAENYLNQLDER
jgi:deoxyribodipyrimidine photolyase-related protein